MALYPSSTLYPATTLYPCSSGGAVSATQYIPTKHLNDVINALQFSSTVSALNTAIQTQWGSLGTIVVQADTKPGQTSNALIVYNDQQVFSVAPNNWVAFNGGVWTQWAPAQVNGDINSIYAQYFTS
jgi:hypothetical protein